MKANFQKCLEKVYFNQFVQTQKHKCVKIYFFYFYRWTNESRPSLVSFLGFVDFTVYIVGTCQPTAIKHDVQSVAHQVYCGFISYSPGLQEYTTGTIGRYSHHTIHHRVHKLTQSTSSYSTVYCRYQRSLKPSYNPPQST